MANVFGRDIQDPDLGSHDDQVVLGDVVAGRAQPVTVEHRADHRTVRERDRGRTVPGLHEGGVVLVEGSYLRLHGLVVVPRLRDHHQHSVRERPPVHDQELEHVVERGGVTARFLDHRQGLLQVLFHHLGAAERRARPHPVDIAAQRVDLTIVGDVAVRMRERPRRERVGAEALVDERQRGFHVGVA